MTPQFTFDNPPDRRGTDSIKWTMFDEDVLPMWVADMDFAAPPAVIEALHARVAQGHFGYALDVPGLREVIVARMADRYGWTIDPKTITFFPGVVSALYACARISGQVGDGVLVQTPVYGPFFSATTGGGRVLHTNELIAVREGQTLSYEIDFDAFEAAIQPNTRMFILCNPHNPVGRAFRRDELERMAEICLRHNLLIVSDEIHSDLLLGDTKHIPIASLSPEIAANTITLLAPSKTYNLPGLSCSLAIAENETLLKRLGEEVWAAGHVPSLGFVAALAAYRDGGAWLDQLLHYLTENRDLLVQFVAERLPQVATTLPEATYLAWLDCRGLELGEKMADFCMKTARVAVNDGAWFGQGGAGFIRLNFGCSRATLLEGLQRISTALQTG